MGTASPQLRAGQLRGLAVGGQKRFSELPDVPTFREQGFNIEGGGWYAAYAPAKTPKDAIDRLAAAIIEGIRSPDVREKLEALGLSLGMKFDERLLDTKKEA